MTCYIALMIYILLYFIYQVSFSGNTDKNYIVTHAHLFTFTARFGCWMHGPPHRLACSYWHILFVRNITLICFTNTNVEGEFIWGWTCRQTCKELEYSFMCNGRIYVLPFDFVNATIELHDRTIMFDWHHRRSSIKTIQCYNLFNVRLLFADRI